MTEENETAQLPPYARALGMIISDNSGEAPVIEMPFDDKVQGRPGFLHGGAISGLLEMAAVAAIHKALISRGSDAPIKQVNVTVDFMRGGLTKTTYAVGHVVRMGRTMANVEATAWQDDPKKPISRAQMHYLIKTKSGPT
ncbi:PaaI family thioesterase [Sphingorhabdus arenilitoris]|uniref:PaaI family thioesterase n=1 Tax=Sphingorhabdus arenilitoris TaxID=1490041 RepID=A0ABV8RES0_9SPHN